MNKTLNIVGIPVITTKKKLNQSGYIEDVDLLVTDYNDKAFMYKNGKVDIIKNGVQKTVTFPNKKDAVLYLMKTGWKYV